VIKSYPAQPGLPIVVWDYNTRMITHAPTRPGRLAQAVYILKNYGLDRSKPFLASFKLGYRCNLSCIQCPFREMTAPELTYAQACRVLDNLHQRGSRIVVLEGGEPLLWQDGPYQARDIIEYARPRFFSVGVTTNGTLPLDVPADVLWVSVDGFKGTHNALRRAPVFDQVIANARASRHPRLMAHVTINAVNAPEIPALLGFLNGIFHGITVQFYYPYNRADALFLDFDRREKLLTEIIALKKGGVRVLNSAASLERLKRNTWRCRDALIDNANPDGSLQQGCYLKGRADIDCARCGFSPHTEVSLAIQGNIQAVMAGLRIFMT
jgi:Fe-coproporphyrin III synthase